MSQGARSVKSTGNIQCRCKSGSKWHPCIELDSDLNHNDLIPKVLNIQVYTIMIYKIFLMSSESLHLQLSFLNTQNLNDFDNI